MSTIHPIWTAVIFGLFLIPLATGTVRAGDGPTSPATTQSADAVPDGAPDKAAMKAAYTKQYASSTYYDYELDVSDVVYAGTHEGDWY